VPGDGVGIRANRIRIARLGIDLAIIEGDGIDAPIGKAAHFPSSAWPGGGSNIYIYGHARDGMFITLWKARIGDEVELGLVDGTTRTYVVAKVLPEVPWDAVQYLEPTPTEQLTLQTSTSYYPTAPRFVVIAFPRS
jgi:LPXTG-site transpeptidase (sortase) family protein